jgi:hypothetical protein
MPTHPRCGMPGMNTGNSRPSWLRQRSGGWLGTTGSQSTPQGPTGGVTPPLSIFQVTTPEHCRFNEWSSVDKGTLLWIEDKPVPGKTAPPLPEGYVFRDEKRFPLLQERLDSFAPDPNPDAISLIHYDLINTVTSIEVSTGEKIKRQYDLPSLQRTFVVPLVFPLVGFLLPWGAMRTIAWIAAGFMTAKGA